MTTPEEKFRKEIHACVIEHVRHLPGLSPETREYIKNMEEEEFKHMIKSITDAHLLPSQSFYTDFQEKSKQ